MVRKLKKFSGYPVVFIGGKQIGVNCLKQLLKFKITPSLVIPNLDDIGTDTWHESLTKFAFKNNLTVISGKKIKDPEVVAKIHSLTPEIIFCIGGTQIIPPAVLRIPKLGTLNIHPALLPKYRGRYSTVHAIFNGERSTGVTIHWMDEGIDSGPIIMQKKIKIEKYDTARSLYDKFTKVGEQLFVLFLKKWTSGERTASHAQDDAVATYYPQMLPNNGQINWNWDGKKILKFIRSMTFEPFSPVTFKIGGKEMVVVDKKYFSGFKK